jgi:hypothetical protein
MMGQVPGWGIQQQIYNLFILVEDGVGSGFFVYNGAPALGNPPILAITNASKDPYGNTVTPQAITDYGMPFLIYSGPPAAGNLIISVASEAGTDEFTNPYPMGISVGASNAGQVQLIPGNPSFILFPVAGTWNNYPLIGVKSSTSSSLNIQSGSDPIGKDTMFIEFNSGIAGSGANWYMTYLDSNGGNNTQIEGTYAGTAFYVVNTLIAVEPGTGTSTTNPAKPESWHNLPAWSGGNVLTGTGRYRLTPDNEIEIEINGTFSITGSPVSADLPAAYQPDNAMNWPIFGGDRANINTSGAITVFSVTAGSTVGFCQRIPLN